MAIDVPLSIWWRGFFKARRVFAPIEWRIRYGLESARTVVRPLQDIPWPSVDLAQRDPVAAIIATPEFRQAAEWFVADRDRPMTSACSRALLYCLARNLKPSHALEIGTYRAGSSEAICRALQLNGAGVLHTTDPFGRLRVPPVLRKWPRALRRHVCFYPWNSMQFLMHVQAKKITTSLAFVDGCHDHAFALFDLLAVVDMTRPGGFVVMDNIDLPGVVQAVDDFLRSHPGWTVCGENAPGSRWVDQTVFCILRAPPAC